MKNPALFSLFLLCLAGATLSSDSGSSSCSACDRFLPQLIQVAAQAGHGNQEGAEGDEDAGDLDVELEGCQAMEAEFLEACGDVARTYGLEHVELLVQRAPHFLCEHVEACRREASDAKGGSIAAKVGGEGSLVDYADELVETQVFGLGLANVAGGLAEEPKFNPIGGLSVVGSGLNMMNQQALIQQTAQEQILNRSIEKLRRAEARSRALNRDLEQMRKDTWRAQPGHCDCCDGCLVAA